MRKQPLISVFELLLDFLLPKNRNVRELESVKAEGLSARLSYKRIDAVENAFCLFDYRDPLIKRMVWEVKYKGNRIIARSFAEILHGTLVEQLSDEALYNDFENPLLIPMPLSRARHRKRGFNQVELIAEELCGADKGKIYMLAADQLVRVRHTLSQTALLSKESRARNVEGAFSVYSRDAIKDRNIILLDDVITTGSTMKEARKALLEAGAKSVLCVGLAH